MQGNVFAAPWSRMLRVTSISVLIICWGVAGLVYTQVEHPLWRWASIMAFLIPPLSALFIVRGYEVTERKLRIRRSFWHTEFDLTDLKSAEVDPEATKWSIRLAGNGGAFAFCGWYRNSRLGVYRLFATDLRLSVVLRFPKRTIVVTPDEPERFVKILKTG